MQDSRAVPGDIARAALIAFGLIAAGVTVIAVVESYSNILAFARAYGLDGWRAAIAPGVPDSFIVMGELLLFAAILKGWGKGSHILGAAMVLWGFALSVGGNVWHAPSASAADRAVSAIWPVTATAALAGALLIVRQVAGQRRGQQVRIKPPQRGTSGDPARPGRPGNRAAGARAAWAAENQAELDRLLASGDKLPSAYALARARSWSRPRATKVLELARSGMNGGGHDHDQHDQ
jgi:uncharacterized protein DUF2637